MNPKRAKAAFEKRLREAGLKLNKMTPAQGIDSMLSFYRLERADGCSFDQDADMLLYQWGTYDWGNGEHFELNITRQLMIGGFEDENIWQLSLTFRFIPSDAHRQLGSGTDWCRSLGEIDRFDQYIHDSKSFQFVAGEAPVKAELYFECVG